MTFEDCIRQGVTNNEITADQASEAIDLFTELREQYNKQLGPGPAASKAAIDAAEAVKRQAIQRKRRTLLQAQAWKQIKKDFSEYNLDARQATLNDLNEKLRSSTNPAEIKKLNEQIKDISTGDAANAALSLIEQDTISKYSSVVQLREAITRRATGMMDQYLATFRRDIVGRTRNKAQLKNVVREIFGENTGDSAASEMAQAWKKASDYLRTRFNAAGGAISARFDWGMPQNHNSLEVKAAGFENWRDFTLGKLNLEKMIDERTGFKFTPTTIEATLRDVWETIGTEGYNKLKDTGSRGRKSVASRNTDHRFLVFKNADDWMKYQERFGNPNAFDVMIGHIDVMARDIALMERLGPNPSATINFIQQTLKKEASGGSKRKINRANTKAERLAVLYDGVTGRDNAPIDGFVATVLAGTRQELQAAQLGGAALVAVTDMNFNRITRAFNGLPQANTLNGYLKYMNPLGLEEKGRIAVRMGLVAEGWTTLASAQMRFVGDLSGPEITRRMSDFVMRASLLSPWTQAGRWAFGMEFLGTLADNVGKEFMELNPALRGAMERYNIGADRWDIIRSSPLYEDRGATFVRANNIAERLDIDPRLADDVATKLLIMIDTETNFAVPSTSLRGRTALKGNTRPGSVPGELLRSFAMYKGFGVTLVNTHIMRGLNMPTAAGKGKYMAGFIISTTLMGALAIQMKEMSKGRDPAPMFGDDAAKFWGGALLQGGGLGIFGDFLFNDVNRFGGGIAETVAGPVIGLLNDTRKLTIGNAAQMITGQDSNMATEMVGFTQRYLPGSSMWYTRLALERSIWDQLKIMTDPKSTQKIRSIERKYQKRGQEYWWKPGETSPRRAPTLSNILE